MQPLNLQLHAKQTLAYCSEATEVLYGGAAGGGKSHLFRVASIIWCSRISGLQVYLFRRISDDLYKNHMSGPGSYPELLGPWMEAGLAVYNGSKNYIEFTFNGARIWLCHCQHEKDVIKYQGAEIHVLMIDELTHFTDYIYRYLRGRCRLGGLKLPTEFKGQFPKVLAGANPGGVGHNFVKRTFIENCEPMEIRAMNDDEGGMRRQFIPARLSDNPTLLLTDPTYLRRLKGLGDPALVKAMANGDWNIVAGGALDDVWDDSAHRVEPFKIPAQWKVDRSFDWGSTHPFSVGWWAESNGEEVQYNGRTICFPAGTLIRIAEWYGGKEIGTNEGLKLSPTEIAEGIKSREARMLENGFIQALPVPGPADNQIYAVTDTESDSIGKKMAKAGVKWIQSDKKPGSRIVGLNLLRERLKNTKEGEGPGIVFFTNCKATFSVLPVLPRDPKNPEDVDTASEDHLYDDVRYRVLSSAKKFASSVEVTLPT